MGSNPPKKKTKEKKLCLSIKKLKEVANDIAISEYPEFYRSLCRKDQKWLHKIYGIPK